MISVIKNWSLLKNSLPKLIDLSDYTTDLLSEKIGLSKDYFLSKKRRNSFSNDEFEKLIALIWRDEFQDILDEELLIEKMYQGRNLSAIEFKQKMGWI